VTARHKDTASAIEKTIRKGYGLPSQQMTDLVGVRVVTYYASDVDTIVARLKASLELHPDRRKSPDKRVELDVREFGYRSVHLVVRGQGGQLTRHPILRGRWFEVQVRSILEHSWAEIEHEIVYKSGATRDDAITRRFSSMAAVLEMVDDGFEDLREAQKAVAAAHSANYSAGLEFDERLDAARLAAIMSVLKPDEPGWHEGPASLETAPNMAARMVDALAFAGVRTGSELRDLLASASLTDDVAEYATAASITVEQVSHVTHLMLLLGGVDRALLSDCFPGESVDPALEIALAA
jgi:ppGpp synthetase/RelA/SpoT-type nucleotidyltranferase